MSHAQTHGGLAAQATRRGEKYVACSTCGQRSHPRYQAVPITRDYSGIEETLTMPRLIGWAMVGFTFWIVFLWMVL